MLTRVCVAENGFSFAGPASFVGFSLDWNENGWAEAGGVFNFFFLKKVLRSCWLRFFFVVDDISLAFFSLP